VTERFVVVVELHEYDTEKKLVKTSSGSCLVSDAKVPTIEEVATCAAIAADISSSIRAHIGAAIDLQ
jgi:hypothetical protein